MILIVRLPATDIWFVKGSLLKTSTVDIERCCSTARSESGKARNGVVQREHRN
jgi:hypothetical protein